MPQLSICTCSLRATLIRGTFPLINCLVIEYRNLWINVFFSRLRNTCVCVHCLLLSYTRDLWNRWVKDFFCLLYFRQQNQTSVKMLYSLKTPPNLIFKDSTQPYFICPRNRYFNCFLYCDLLFVSIPVQYSEMLHSAQCHALSGCEYLM